MTDWLRNSTIEIKGRANGKEYLLTGVLDSGDVRVEEEEPEYLISFYEKLPITPPAYVLNAKFKLVDGKSFTVKETKMKTTEVEYRAVIESTDRTVEAMETARKRVGAPTSAKVRFFDFVRKPELEIDIAAPMPCRIEFVWWGEAQWL